MAVRGWKTRYREILREFRYSENKDRESAVVLNSILKKTDSDKRMGDLIAGNTVLVIGSGPSLSSAIPKLKNYGRTVKIAADSSVKPLIENGIMPDIIVTDLDGDMETLEKIADSPIFVVHAHGDNMEKLECVKRFKDCIGTTQTAPFGKLENFGGFTDGDRGVFLANHFQAKKIILFGMDFGERIGGFSETKRSERKTKLMKLRRGELLLNWLATFAESELFTTSRPIKGFKKISYRELDTIIT